MFTKILSGSALVIVISIIPFLQGSESPSTEPLPNVAPTSPPPAPALVQQAPASGSATETQLPASKSETVARPEITFELRQYPEDPEPSNRDYTIRVRLDVGRLRTHDLTKEDVIKGLTEGCSIIGSPRPPEPPPGVVYFPRVIPDRVENLILKANPDGEIVRLRDVAKNEVAGMSTGEIEHPSNLKQPMSDIEH